MWRKQLIDLLRTGATSPSRAVIAGKDRELTDEEIAQRWGELGGNGEDCSVANVRWCWIDIDQAGDRVVPAGNPRRAHDIADRVRQALHNPDASPEFVQAAESYYRQLREVNPQDIPAYWRDWPIRSHARGERQAKAAQNDVKCPRCPYTHPANVACEDWW